MVYCHGKISWCITAMCFSDCIQFILKKESLSMSHMFVAENSLYEPLLND